MTQVYQQQKEKAGQSNCDLAGVKITGIFKNS